MSQQFKSIFNIFDRTIGDMCRPKQCEDRITLWLGLLRSRLSSAQWQATQTREIINDSNKDERQSALPMAKSKE